MTICHTPKTIVVHMMLYPIALALTVISAPSTIPEERGSIVVSDQHGTERWTADFTMEPAREGGLPAVRFTEKDFCVRYEGPENGPGSPQIVMNLKSYRP